MAAPEPTHVVTCFLLRRDLDEAGRSRDSVLLLRRSGRVGTYRGRWAAVSGYVEHAPDEQARIELAEEAGLGPDDVVLLRKGAPLDVIDRDLGKHWLVHPYLFLVAHPEHIRLDWEHTESRWVSPADMPSYETVPGLRETLDRVYPEGGNSQSSARGARRRPPP